MIGLLVSVLEFAIKMLYRDRPIPRFYVLETVARVRALCFDISPEVIGHLSIATESITNNLTASRIAKSKNRNSV
jgi:hypothetical protein